MPVPELKSYVAAADEQARHAIVSAHLDRMENQLLQTQDAVAALRALITPTGITTRIDIRHEDAVLAAAITETVRLDDVVTWWHSATKELDDALRAAGAAATGPIGGLYDHALFADEEGAATVWLPLGATHQGQTGRVVMTQIPGGAFAVAVHDGPDARIDETYSALGTYVADRGIGRPGPLRERYLAGALDDPRPLITEVAWPILAG